MQYEAKIENVNGDVVHFDFHADTNELASDHLAHCCSDHDMMAMTFKEQGFTRSKVLKAHFRRYYAERWICSVDMTNLLEV